MRNLPTRRKGASSAAPSFCAARRSIGDVRPPHRARACAWPRTSSNGRGQLPRTTPTHPIAYTQAAIRRRAHGCPERNSPLIDTKYRSNHGPNEADGSAGALLALRKSVLARFPLPIEFQIADFSSASNRGGISPRQPRMAPMAHHWTEVSRSSATPPR